MIAISESYHAVHVLRAGTIKSSVDWMKVTPTPNINQPFIHEKMWECCVHNIFSRLLLSVLYHTSVNVSASIVEMRFWTFVQQVGCHLLQYLTEHYAPQSYSQ